MCSGSLPTVSTGRTCGREGTARRCGGPSGLRATWLPHLVAGRGALRRSYRNVAHLEK